MKKTTLSRRTFLLGLAASPLHGVAVHRRELREQFQLDHRIPVLMIMSAHLTPESAEKWRREYAVQPFDGMGEWYLQSSTVLELPKHLADLPGSMIQFDYVAGVAAAKSSMLVGAFRRDHIACVYRVRGSTEHLMALAEDFAKRKLPEPAELLWNPGRLELLVPTAERLGMDVSPSDAFWP